MKQHKLRHMALIDIFVYCLPNNQQHFFFFLPLCCYEFRSNFFVPIDYSTEPAVDPPPGAAVLPSFYSAKKF